MPPFLFFKFRINLRSQQSNNNNNTTTTTTRLLTAHSDRRRGGGFDEAVGGEISGRMYTDFWVRIKQENWENKEYSEKLYM